MMSHTFANGLLTDLLLDLLGKRLLGKECSNTFILE